MDEIAKRESVTTHKGCRCQRRLSVRCADDHGARTPINAHAGRSMIARTWHRRVSDETARERAESRAESQHITQSPRAKRHRDEPDACALTRRRIVRSAQSEQTRPKAREPKSDALE